MDLTTRCPQCGTTFSASLEQLQLRKGYIRCINCAHIFDGFEAVVSQGGAAPADQTPPRAAEPTVSMPSVLRQRPAETADEDHTLPPIRAGRDEKFTISSSRQASSTEQDPVFHVGRSGLSARPDPVVSMNDEYSTPAVARSRSSHPHVYIEPPAGRSDAEPARHPEFLSAAPAGVPVLRLLWRALVVLALVLLVAQLAYVYRAQIANSVPVLRPALERACVSLDCQVPYARQIDQISIMSSSLRSGSGAGLENEQAANKDDSGPDVMLLQLTLRNTYDKAQEWPTLVLDLTDFSGAMVVRKNLPPQSYLPANVMGQPFLAGSEITASVPVVLNGVKVNGYQLDKFFQ